MHARMNGHNNYISTKPRKFAELIITKLNKKCIYENKELILYVTLFYSNSNCNVLSINEIITFSAINKRLFRAVVVFQHQCCSLFKVAKQLNQLILDRVKFREIFLVNTDSTTFPLKRKCATGWRQRAFKQRWAWKQLSSTRIYPRIKRLLYMNTTPKKYI